MLDGSRNYDCASKSQVINKKVRKADINSLCYAGLRKYLLAKTPISLSIASSKRKTGYHQT